MAASTRLSLPPAFSSRLTRAAISTINCGTEPLRSTSTAPTSSRTRRQRYFKKQGLTGNIVLTTSANAVVAKKGSLAYDTSKAAANHLVRELAVEMAPLVRVNAVAPATVVKGSTMFPRDRVIASLTKYDIVFDESEETDVLDGEIICRFTLSRSLTQTPIEPRIKPKRSFLLLSARLSKTTGHIIPVDGGLQDGFMR